jgi:tRNA pseudouridine32 synthase/23S rRNA pseudouridine746 synthase
MDTSGLLVVALDAETQRELSGQFERREVEKAYIAVVDGNVEPESGTVEAPIRPDYLNRPYQVVDPSHKRPAVTAFKVLERGADRTRVELIPLTGRTHQLRVHMAWRGHAILGDVLYGEQPRIAEAAPRLLLHAVRLVFTDPWAGTRVEVVRAAAF